MRIVAVDATSDGKDAKRALVTALAQAPTRLLLFRAAATLAAAQVQAEQARQDERFLDVAARWLLDRGSGPPPTRAGLAVPLLEIGVAVRDDLAAAPLPSTPRVIELSGSQLWMAVPDRGRVHDEEWENAALWIAGGEAIAGVHTPRERLVVVPGSAEAGAGLALVDLVGAEARVSLLDGDGALGPARSFPLGGGARISVQAAQAVRR